MSDNILPDNILSDNILSDNVASQVKFLHHIVKLNKSLAAKKDKVTTLRYPKLDNSKLGSTQQQKIC